MGEKIGALKGKKGKKIRREGDSTLVVAGASTDERVALVASEREEKKNRLKVMKRVSSVSKFTCLI